jgi:hypothetical protein
MAVVINEFELMPASQPASQPGEASSFGGQGPQNAPSPEAIEKIVRLQIERLERVWAH